MHADCLSPPPGGRVSACAGCRGDAQDKAGRGRFLLVTFLDETVKSPMKFGRLQHDAHLLLLLPQYMVVVIASFDFLRDHLFFHAKEKGQQPIR